MLATVKVRPTSRGTDGPSNGYLVDQVCLEILLAARRIGLDGVQVVDIAAALPEFSPTRWWPWNWVLEDVWPSMPRDGVS